MKIANFRIMKLRAMTDRQACRGFDGSDVSMVSVEYEVLTEMTVWSRAVW
jgi:hypothetical protein